MKGEYGVAHSCPECGQTCYCGSDIDDCLFDFDEDSDACTHCVGKERDDEDDCMDCGMCDACIAQTKAYFEEMEASDESSSAV